MCVGVYNMCVVCILSTVQYKTIRVCRYIHIYSTPVSYVNTHLVHVYVCYSICTCTDTHTVRVCVQYVCVQYVV